LNDQLPEDLFAMRRGEAPRLELLGGRLPILLIDDVYRDPGRIRSKALKLEYREPKFYYPGRIADIPASNPSAAAFARNLLKLVNGVYLPQLRSVFGAESKVTKGIVRVRMDFGVIDKHPSELEPIQRQPHRDPVPIFGLIYLNEEHRGGTMFFEPRVPPEPSEERSGYFREDDEDFRLIGKIEGRYNQLAIYPGFIPHCGEISGDWIETDDRLTKPRLTQRFQFFP
jgi:hypothetical protein